MMETILMENFGVWFSHRFDSTFIECRPLPLILFRKKVYTFVELDRAISVQHFITYFLNSFYRFSMLLQQFNPYACPDRPFIHSFLYIFISTRDVATLFPPGVITQTCETRRV